MSDNLYVTIYSRFKTQSTVTTLTNDFNEMGIVVYNSSLITSKIRSLNTYSDVNLIKSAKFGNRIIIGYSRTSQEANDGYLPEYASTTDDSMYVMIVTATSAVVLDPIEIPNFSLSPSDDWRTLSDGRVAWTYVGTDSTLTLWSVAGSADTNTSASYGNPPSSDYSEPAHAFNLSPQIALYLCILFSLILFPLEG